MKSYLRYLRCLMVSIGALITFMMWAGTYSIESLPNVQLQDHTKHLVNPDGIISAPVQAQIDSLLLDARRRSSAEVVAVIVDSIDPDDIDNFSTQLINKWGIGKKDKNNGILIIVTKDQNAATIRTGYGSEGVLPDILAGRIVRDVMIPYFKNEDFDNGLLAGVKAVHALVTDPDAVAELMSSEADNYPDIDGTDILNAYIKVAEIAAIALALWFIGMLVYVNTRKPALNDYQKYTIVHKYQLIFWVVSLLFMGIPVLAAIVMYALTWYWRNHPRKCPHCHTQMKKLDEVTDNQYLTYAQDLEERIKSVDYDVWLCPKCNEKDITSYINRASSYHECPACHARTEKLAGVRILNEPTYSREGTGVKEYVCLNCNNRRQQSYRIPKKEKPVVIVGPGGGGRGGGFGGGSFGGGFGGGLSGGGGATGRW